MEIKSAKITAVFLPRTMGVFILLIIVLSFAVGTIRGEMVLTLTGAVFLAIWLYCLVMTLLLALFQKARAARVSISLSPEKIVAGGSAQVNYTEVGKAAAGKKIFQFPLIVVRCKVRLYTKDGRRAVCDLRPQPENNFSEPETLQVKKRGAYFPANDELAIFDILGFFRFAYRIPAGRNALLASPRAAEEAVPVRAKGGDTDRHDAQVLERTDDLIDHRPYVPGDDPRRINWKLYGHGGELFIRQGEREPPPHSNITILIDTQYDSLYTAKTAPDAVDLLCENALAIINSIGKDKDVVIGFTGQSVESSAEGRAALERNPAPDKNPGFFLAYPFAAFSPSAFSPSASQASESVSINGAYKATELPPVPEERAIVILALPRISTNTFTLDNFLSKNANRPVELIFIYGADKIENGALKERVINERAHAAETCVSLYNKRSGVRAQMAAVKW